MTHFRLHIFNNSVRVANEQSAVVWLVLVSIRTSCDLWHSFPPCCLVSKICHIWNTSHQNTHGMPTAVRKHLEIIKRMTDKKIMFLILSRPQHSGVQLRGNFYEKLLLSNCVLSQNPETMYMFDTLLVVRKTQTLYYYHIWLKKLKIWRM